MGNPLLNRLGKGIAGQSNPQSKSIVEQFREFKASMQGENPQKKLDELMSSGNYTQEQLKQATELANLVKGFAKK